MASRKIERRAFLEGTATVAASLAFGCGTSGDDASNKPTDTRPPWERAQDPAPPSTSSSSGGTPATPPTNEPALPLPKRRLGSTDLEVSLLSLGTWLGGIQNGTREEAIAIVQRALDEGINYIDIAPTYAPAEQRVGEAIVGRRNKIFLGSKTTQRTKDAARFELENTLKDLRTDWLDIWQVHAISAQSEVDAVFAPGGALEAFIQARDEKLVRYIGLTGHARPDLLAQMIERFPFDTVLTAVNVADWYRRPTVEQLVPIALQKKMGIIGMKTFGGPAAKVLESVSVKDALSWVWSLPISTTIVGASSVEHVSENAAACRAFVPFTTARADEISKGITAEAAAAMQWFKQE